jgi:hypothetical protein
LLEPDGASLELLSQTRPRVFITHSQVVRQPRLVPHEDTNLEEGGMSAPNLGQADHLHAADHHLVR